MQIPKELVVQRIRARGDLDLTQRAERELPEKVDPETDAELLRLFDVDPSSLGEGFDGRSPAVG
jgi:hypothetical protein